MTGPGGSGTSDIRAGGAGGVGGGRLRAGGVRGSCPHVSVSGYSLAQTDVRLNSYILPPDNLALPLSLPSDDKWNLERRRQLISVAATATTGGGILKKSPEKIGSLSADCPATLTIYHLIDISAPPTHSPVSQHDHKSGGELDLSIVVQRDYRSIISLVMECQATA